MCAAARDKKPGFDSEFTGEILKIKLRGEIDHHSAVALRGAVDDMIRQRRPQKLVIDMSAVELMDSSGLGLIMGRYALMNEIGGATVVLDPSPRVEKIMSLAGLERIVKVEYSTHKEQTRDQEVRDQKKRAIALNSVDDFGSARAPRTRKEGERK
jgi:stage II sporulation protein AA (anti-sigma F factor antagonist)